MTAKVNTQRTNRKIARTVGVLFIIATVMGVLSQVFLGPVLADPDYLINFSTNANQIIIGALVDLTGAGAFVILAIVLFPLFCKHNESIALGYVIARSLEAVPFVVANISLLALITLSQEYVQAASEAAAYFLPVGTGLLAIYDFAQLLGPRIFASLAAVPFYYLLYQSKLLPRWIPVWGFIAAPLYFASGLLAMFGLVDPFSPILILLFLPAALLEMVLAIWLIVKGFNSVALASPSAQ